MKKHQLRDVDWQALRAEPPWSSLSPALIEETWAAAPGPWRDIALAPLEFFRFLGVRLPNGVPTDEAVRALPLPDVYVACACLSSADHACATFDQIYLRSTRAALSRYALPEAVVEDIQQ